VTWWPKQIAEECFLRRGGFGPLPRQAKASIAPVFDDRSAGLHRDEIGAPAGIRRRDRPAQQISRLSGGNARRGRPGRPRPAVAVLAHSRAMVHPWLPASVPGHPHAKCLPSGPAPVDGRWCDAPHPLGRANPLGPGPGAAMGMRSADNAMVAHAAQFSGP
jgi:hypothetical protein